MLLGPCPVVADDAWTADEDWDEEGMTEDPCMWSDGTLTRCEVSGARVYFGDTSWAFTDVCLTRVVATEGEARAECRGSVCPFRLCTQSILGVGNLNVVAAVGQRTDGDLLSAFFEKWLVIGGWRRFNLPKSQHMPLTIWFGQANGERHWFPIIAEVHQYKIAVSKVPAYTNNVCEVAIAEAKECRQRLQSMFVKAGADADTIRYVLVAGRATWCRSIVTIWRSARRARGRVC